ncbi:MAG: hypothetical protein ACPG5B_12905 [Chitinophagales bacterium]
MMINSKLIELASKIPKRQFKRLQDFLESPYFNKKEELIALYHFLASFQFDFTHEKLTKANAFIYVYGKHKPYDEKEMGYMMSQLTQLINDFLAHEQLRNDDMMKSQLLMPLYNDWDLDKSFSEILKKANKFQKKKRGKDSDYYFNQFKIYLNEAEQFAKKQVHAQDVALQKAIDFLDYYYIATKLQYSCAILSRSLAAKNYQVKLIQELKKYLQNNSHENHYSIHIYHTILQTVLDSDNGIHFIKLKKLMEKYIHHFEPEEATGIYTHAVNYCVRRINNGQSHYAAELLTLYKDLLKNRLIFEGNYLSQWNYTNIVSIAIRNEEFEWTKEFIRAYKTSLDPVFRKNAYTYNLAYLFFHQKEYDKVLELLPKVEFKDVLYGVSARLLLIKSYYEQNYVMPFASLVDSFKMYLKRNKIISDDMRKRHLNFLKYIDAVQKELKGNNVKLLKLKQKIEADKQTINKAWLLEKVNAKIKIRK